MASLIHELENNEALLLMYATDELPVEDRVEVEQMLANDAGLRAELNQIRLAYDFSNAALSKLDEHSGRLISENFAIRHACRAMKQWHVDQLSRLPIELPPARRKVPVWAYPAASAAVLLIGGLIWWGDQGDIASDLPASTVASVEQDTKQVESSLENDVSPLADAETQANALTDRSDDQAVASSIFMLDANQ